MLTISEIEKLPIVFIIGRGRSGTTLLQTIFDANPSVITANESPFIIHLKQKYSTINNWSSSKIDEFITDLYKDVKFVQLWSIDQSQLKKRITQYPVTELSFSTLCKLVYLEITSPFAKDKISLIIDKNPIYSFFIKDLVDVFPNAKFIHLIRDYRDNVISSRKAFKINDVALLAMRWKKYNMFIDNRKKDNAKLFYTLQYEKLVTHPEKLVPELCAFVDIAFNPAMLDFHETTKKIYTVNSLKNDVLNSIVQDIHTNLLNPINSNQIGKWKSDLTHSEIETVDYIAGKYAVEYDYDPTTKVFKFNYLIKAFKSYIRYMINYTIYKTYYKIPMKLRDVSRRMSKLLYDKFGYLNTHNKIGVIYKKD